MTSWTPSPGDWVITARQLGLVRGGCVYQVVGVDALMTLEVCLRMPPGHGYRATGCANFQHRHALKGDNYAYFKLDWLRPATQSEIAAAQLDQEDAL